LASTPSSPSPPPRPRPRPTPRSEHPNRTPRHTPTIPADQRWPGPARMRAGPSQPGITTRSRARPWTGSPAFWSRLSLDMHYGTGQCSRNTGHGLNFCHYKAAQIVDIFRFGPDDHVVWPDDVLRLGDARELADANSDLSSLADFCLNENVRLHHAVLPELAP